MCVQVTHQRAGERMNPRGGIRDELERKMARTRERQDYMAHKGLVALANVKKASVQVERFETGGVD
jgi:hypothetical protein